MALTTGLTAYWDFNSQVRGADVEDVVGSNNLTSSSAANTYPFVTGGVKGFGREFDSADGLYLGCSDSADVSIATGEDFTLVTWIMFHDHSPVSDYRLPGSSDPLKAIIRKGGAVQFDDEWKLVIELNPSNFWFARFDVNEAGTFDSDRASSYIKGNIQKMYSQVWHMCVCTYNATTLGTSLKIYQGINSKTGRMFPDGSSALWRNSYSTYYKSWLDSNNNNTTSTGFTAARDAGYDLRFGAPIYTYSTARDKADFSVDATGIWNRVLTDRETDFLYNGGYGLEHPFLPPWTDIYAPKPTPLFLPRPESLYEGHGWNVGTIPDNSPAPNGWHHTQPTLPAWRTPPRIAGWSYGNNFPRPAPEPLVSQWWIQASEPVKTAPKVEHLSPPETSVTSDIEPVIPDPPVPPAPPIDDSEAQVSDEVYRPGRADQDDSLYGRS